MPRTFATWATSPSHANLVARDGGLVLTALAAGTINRVARSDIAANSGSAGVEFAWWGEDALQAVVGVQRTEAGMSQYVGANAQGVGWRLDTGQILHNGVQLGAAMPAVAKGDIVGLRVSIGTPNSTLQWTLNDAVVRTVTVAITGPLHYAASMITSAADTLYCAVNAGQWMPRSIAAAEGWAQATASPPDARVSDLDFLAAAADPVPHARYEGVMVDGVTTVEAIGFWAWSDQPSTGSGAEATVLDPDGRLDALTMSDHAGAAVQLKRTTSTVAASVALGRYRLEGVVVVDDVRKRLLLADAHDDLDLKLSRGTFLPNLPSLAWRPLPVVIGAVASVPALPASVDGTVRYLADAAVHVGDVMDRGDVMEPGTFGVSSDGQQLGMLSPPVGPVVADCSRMGLSAGQPVPATLQQALADIFGRIGKGAWSAADAAAIDTATGYAGVGYYASDAVTARTALTAILSSYGAWLWRAADGTLRIARVVAPESVAHSIELAGADMFGDLVRVADTAPHLTRRMAYRLNAQALAASDLVTDFVDVPQARRDQLTGLWRGLAYAPGTLPARYAHADSAAPFLSVFWGADDARAEIRRVIAIYGTERASYEASFRGVLSTAPTPGSVVLLSYPKYGLNAGKRLLVRRVARNEGTGDVRLTLWG